MLLFIVFDDADLDAAVEEQFFLNIEIMARRVYVYTHTHTQTIRSGEVYDEFAQKLSNAVSKFEVGDGFNENVTLGPFN